MAVQLDPTSGRAAAPPPAELWELALSHEDEPPPAQFTTREAWAASFPTDGEADEGGGAWLQDPAGHGPRLSLLEVPELETARNRLHIDVLVSRDAEDCWLAVTTAVDRLVTAGGSVVEFAGHHVFMADPEGNEFCVA